MYNRGLTPIFQGKQMVLIVFDLVDQMQWEDLTDFLTLEEAGLESQDYDTVPAVNRAYYFELEN